MSAAVIVNSMGPADLMRLATWFMQVAYQDEDLPDVPSPIELGECEDMPKILEAGEYAFYTFFFPKTDIYRIQVYKKAEDGVALYSDQDGPRVRVLTHFTFACMAAALCDRGDKLPKWAADYLTALTQEKPAPAAAHYEPGIVEAAMQIASAGYRIAAAAEEMAAAAERMAAIAGGISADGD